ncbi:MAG: GGDEF domain-containing protein [Rhodocyclaceae bacterium]|nr:MAG: GGDEF domain-containing protein [Rhodocyclaceae bacterium]
MSARRLFNRRRLILLLGLLLSAGFMATSLLSYMASRDAIRASIIDQELPLTADNIYTEIQKDLVRPIFISSMMASDTFVRDWVLHGEKDVGQMTRYLKEVQERYGAFTSFFVSDRTSTYYQTQGVLKQVKPEEPRDAWYYRVRNLESPYEINVDPDLANGDKLTIFINYRVLDYQQRFIGATGIGLTVDAVRLLINEYQQRYRRIVYFVDANGRIVLFGNQSGHLESDIREVEGLKQIADKVLREKAGSYQYHNKGSEHLLKVRFIPELNWYLCVEKIEDEALSSIRKALYLNLAICVLLTAVVMTLARLVLNRYQGRLEEMATIDKLTGLLNRQAFDILLQQALAEFQRVPQPLALLLFDVDHFKRINDSFGHLKGDNVLKDVALLLRNNLRQSDLAFRWGGEEFLVVLKGSGVADAVAVAEKIRTAIANHRFGTPETPMQISISAGVTEYLPGDDADRLVGRADAGLYLAKRNGRNRVECGTTDASSTHPAAPA